MLGKRHLAEIVLLLFGIFLVIDGFFIHSLVFKYEIFGLQSIDKYINHEYIGMLFIGLSLLDMRASKMI